MKYFIIPLFFISCLFLSLFSLAASPSKNIYVAENGNDSWSGTLSEPNSSRTDGPFATIEKARDAIRNLKVYDNLNSPVTVQVRGGAYHLDKTFILESRDSGTKECPVTYRAFPGEKVVLSGGKEIKGSWKPYHDKIMVTSIPEVKEGKWNFRQLFVNGKRQIRARTPNTGFFHIADVVHGKDSLASFKYREGDLKRWTNLNDVEILKFNFWDDARLIIAELDEQQSMVRFTGPANYMFNRWANPRTNGENDRYFVENVFEGLDSLGEWYLNRHTGDLYYYPASGETAGSTEFIAPVLNQLILYQGDSTNNKFVQYVNIEGFTLCHADWPLAQEGYEGGWGDLVSPSAVTFIYSNNCVLKNCSITNVGTYGVELSDGCSDNRIDRNEISFTGSGGIRINGKTTKRNTVSNNHVHHCCEIYPGGVGIQEGSAGQNLIAHNHVHDTGYCGITNGGPSNTYEYNHVHHVMQRLCDGAGFYTYGNESDGTIIRNNVFHDVQPYRVFGWGIYLDDKTEYVTVMNNIVYRTRTGGSMTHGGRYTIWLNNIFVDGGDYQIFYDTINNYSYRNVYEKNIYYYTDPQSKLIHNAFRWTFDAVALSDYNLFFCTKSTEMKVERITEVSTFEQWQRKGLDFHSIVADPLFVDPEQDNYTLKENSPAFKLGFQQIDISTVGPQE